MIELTDSDFKSKLKNILEDKACAVSSDRIEDIYEKIISGRKFVKVEQPATLKDGIVQLSSSEQKEYSSFFDQEKKRLSLSKFVPASGAATRMFKYLFEFKQGNDTLNLQDSFWTNIKHLPFYSLIKKEWGNDESFNDLIEKRDISKLVDTILSEEGLGTMPKALIPFHVYEKEVRTAFIEQIFETLHLSEEPLRLHLTISEETKKLFENQKAEFESEQFSNISLEFSYQSKSSQSIAVDEEQQLVFNNDGSLLLRPSGHGALLENLSKIDSDVVFVKNIDNIGRAETHQASVFYKKVLGGLGIEIQTKVFDHLNMLENDPSNTQISEAIDFLKTTLYYKFGSDFYDSERSSQVNFLINCLNRPLRICGMVKNTGAPGGGPFWVKTPEGNGLQIIELVQIENDEILSAATHFNPVDLVCFTKSKDGGLFNLKDFRDENQYIVVEKNHRGRKIWSYETPGLWNGGMAYWNTVFVEVPNTTFKPVKTFFDLLNKDHLSLD
ncbi:MAG: DUF4301 family protein [Flavobacteriales bacterium]|nr:DUF4301 family protein [Flavobacteriales bacterium]